MARAPRYRRAIRSGRIASLPDRQLHQIYGRFQREAQDLVELSDRQNWLWDRVEAELARRWWERTSAERCHCEFCWRSANPELPFSDLE